MLHPLWETVWQFLKKLNLKSPYNPAIPLLGVYPRRNENVHPDDLYTGVYTA